MLKASRNPINHDLVAGLVILISSIAGFAYTFTLYSEAAAFPRFVLICLAALSAVLIVKAFRHPLSKKDRKSFLIHPPRFFMIVSMTLVYAILVSYLGYYSSTLLFMAGTALALGYKNKTHIAMTTLAYLLFVFFVFNYLFSLPFPLEFFQRWSL